MHLNKQIIKMPKHNRNKPIKNFLKFNKISLIKKNLLKIKNKKKI